MLNIKGSATSVACGAIGSLVGGWLLAWFPADAVRKGLSQAGSSIDVAALLTAQVTLPLWYWGLLVILCVGLLIVAYFRLMKWVAGKTGNQLSDDQLAVLSTIGDFEAKKSFLSVPQLARVTGLSHLRVEHALDALIEAEMVNRIWDLVDDDTFQLMAAGRACLVRQLAQ